MQTLFTCHDAMVSVLGKLDVRMLLQLGRVSKSFNAIIRTNGVLRNAVLNLFPGITEVPVVTDYEVYVHILRAYYRPSRCTEYCLHQTVCKAFHHARVLLATFADEGDRLLSSDEFDTIIAVFYERTAHAFDNLKGRAVVRKYMKDWQYYINTWRPPLRDQPHFHNNQAIIDRIAEIASSKFCFHSSDGEKWQIRTNEKLILEVRRHHNARAAYYNPSDANHEAMRENFVDDVLTSESSDDREDDDENASDCGH